MVDVPAPPTGGDRIEPVGLEVEMQSSYLAYAMSVIVGRALPEVRDGLKPVHRRVLYAMYDGGYRPDRSYVKCARVVGDVMGNYHPHGDTAIYDTLVRLAQPWSLRYPLVDGQGNFGSQGNDPAAAMRYCVVAETRVRTADGASLPIDDIAPGAAPNSDTYLTDVKLLGRRGEPVAATRLFHAGEHPTLRLSTHEGYHLTGTPNHPVLCLVPVLGVPLLLWKLLSEVATGDRIALFRGGPAEVAPLTMAQAAAAERLGACVAERVPEVVWRSGPAYKGQFLRALYERVGTQTPSAAKVMDIHYATRSEGLASDIQQLLLELGIVSQLSCHPGGGFTVCLDSQQDALLFAQRVGLRGRKRQLLLDQLARSPRRDAAGSLDNVPFVADYLRGLTASRVADGTGDTDELPASITDPEVRRVVEPLVPAEYYYAEVAQVADAGVRPVFSVRVDSDDHAFLTDGFVSHNTECRLSPLAMEMLRDIDEDTVDFSPNYDSKSREPDILPSRVPDLLINGSGGIAVGMATNVPPHNLREVGAGVQWALAHPDATPEELLAALMERVKGPDFPTGALVVGRDGIEEAYRTGRGSVRMRAVIEIDEDRRGRPILVVTELPYQVNKDNLLQKIKELVEEGRVGGIADLNDEGSARTGLRLVITLKRDAVARVVLNNLYKHSQLQDTFGVNMLAIVDGVPRTLRIDQLVSLYVDHQIDVVVRRTRYRLRKAEERAHILRALLKALDRLDEVIALIRAAESAAVAQGQLMALLDIDEIQARAILDMQLRKLAALERQGIINEAAELEAEITVLRAILDSPARQRQIIGEELAVIVERYGDDRRTRLIPHEGDMSVEDLIAREDVVVTVTRGGYAKRTKSELYRAQRRGGKGVQGASLREDDIVEHFFVTTTHHWLLFFTNQGRVYRCRAHALPEQARSARGQHVANVLQFQPEERIAGVMAIADYGVAPYLVLATRGGMVKKTPLGEYDNGRATGLIAMNLREGDELIGAALVSPEDDLLLVSERAMSIRFHADDEQLRPMGRATSGVIGMRFSGEDQLLSLAVVQEGADLLVATGGGFAKRTPLVDYPPQGRGGKGVLTARIVRTRGGLVGALIVGPDDELFAITSGAGVIRTLARDIRRAGRQTMGVRLMDLADGVTVVAIARNADDEPGAVGVVGPVGEGSNG